MVLGTDNSPASEPPDENAEARVYRIRRGWRAFLLLMGLAFCAGGVFCFVLALDEGKLAAGLLIGVVPVIMGAWFLGGAYRSRVVLQGSELAIHGALLVRRLRAEQAKGRRMQTAQGTRTVVIEPLDPKAKMLRLGSIYEMDEHLAAWVAALPDLDALEIHEATRELMEDRPAWQTREERQNTIELARRIAKLCNGCGLAAFAWAMFVPRPYLAAIAVVALLPWAVLLVAALSGGRIGLDSKPNSPRPHVAIAFIAPSSAFSLRALVDYHVVDWSRALVLVAIVATFVGVALWALDTPFRFGFVQLLLAIFIGAMYAVGAVLSANGLFDKGAATTFHPQVLDKHITAGKHTTYDLSLETWGPDVKSA